MIMYYIRLETRIKFKFDSPVALPTDSMEREFNLVDSPTVESPLSKSLARLIALSASS